MNKFLCHVHIIKVMNVYGEWEPCFPYHSFRICTKKNIFIHLLSFMFIFSFPSPNSFSCTECEKMLISRKLFLKISPHKKHTFRPGISHFQSDIWDGKATSFIAHLWGWYDSVIHGNCFFFLAEFSIHFLHSHPQLNANKIIFPTRWWKKKFLYTENVEKNCYVNKYHCIISRECFSEMPSHLLRGGWWKKVITACIYANCVRQLFTAHWTFIYHSFRKLPFYSPPCCILTILTRM